ncbi:MAG: HTH-type transcriptional regulator LeuO [Candidatus Celerinatantimonas neptuna]|nr:MAG: HTH-type transcriptional regulator LeuO [Candidatus Celerinatantimonas neptuna]
MNVCISDIYMDLQRIDFNLIKVFRWLMIERQVSKAAQRLHISQPALSHSLKRLRELFEDPLFVPVGRQMKPTSLAEQLATTIEQIWQTLESGLAGLEQFNPATSARTFRLVVSASIEYSMLEPVYQRLKQAGGELNLEVTELIHQDYLQALAEREFDMVIGFADSHHLHASLISEPWFSDPLFCLSGTESNAFKSPMTIDQLISREHVYTSSWGHSQLLVDQWLCKHQRKRRLAIQVPSFMAVPPLLLHHPLYAVVPSTVCDFLTRGNHLVAHPLPEELTVHYCLTRHPLYKNDPSLNWLVSELRQCVTTIHTS